jgi:hypothetical protein
VDQAFVHGFVDHGNCRIQQFNADSFVISGDRRSQFLDLRTQFAAVASVYFFASGVLPDPLFS